MEFPGISPRKAERKSSLLTAISWGIIRIPNYRFAVQICKGSFLQLWLIGSSMTETAMRGFHVSEGGRHAIALVGKNGIPIVQTRGPFDSRSPHPKTHRHC